ncbi:MAG: glutaredoxin family protein [Calditrichaeota bacterium]|nr:MAG: glutaredoxin family protein [Calditrichota bacterium]
MRNILKNVKQVRRVNSPETILVEVYSKPGCHLCEVVKQKLEKLQATIPFLLKEIDISRSAQLMEKYGEKIPLVFVDGHLVAKYFLNEEAFLKYMKKAIRGKS